MALPLVITPGVTVGHIEDHEEIHDILSDVELADLWVVTRYLATVIGSRGAAGRAGSLHFATDVGDNGSLSLDTGSGWLDLYRLMPNAIWNLLSGSAQDNISGMKVPCCRVGKTGAQSIPDDSAWHALLWDDESGGNHFNNEGTSMHSITSNTSRFIATREGAYAVQAYVSWDTDATGRRHIRVQKNNGAILTRDSRDAAPGGDDHQSIVGFVEMEIGDYLQIEVLQNAGNALNVQQASVASMWWVSDVG